MKSPFACSTSPSSRPAGAATPELTSPGAGAVEPQKEDSDTRAVLAYLQNSMARDLHDSFPQEFQAVIMHLRVALETKSCIDAKHHVEQAIAAAQTGLNCVRTLIRDLRQHPTQSHGSSAANKIVEVVLKAARGALKTHSLELELSCEVPDATIKGYTALHLAMIVREAIHNAIKHAMPTKLWCQIFVVEQSVVIELRDNGRGFTKEIGTSGFGLIGMQERAGVIGASLKILSDRQQGCSVRLTLPASALITSSSASSSASSGAPASKSTTLTDGPSRSRAALPYLALAQIRSSAPTPADTTTSSPRTTSSSWFDIEQVALANFTHEPDHQAAS